MVEPKFEVFKDLREEFRFRLVASNGEVVAASQGYNEKASCLRGIESVRHNAATAKVFDLSAGEESVGGSKFEVFKDLREEFRFRLVAGNEEIIVASQGYDAKVSCIDGIESVRRNASRAVIVDTTPTASPHEKHEASPAGPVGIVDTAPTIALGEKHGMLWIMLNRLVYSYFFRGMWWRDSITASDYRERYPYEE